MGDNLAKRIWDAIPGDKSVWGPAGLGLHLTLNPRKNVQKARRDETGRIILPDHDISVREMYLRHGLRLGDPELRALKLSRPQGVQAIDYLLSRTPVFSELTPDQRLDFAVKATDLLLDTSMEAKLSREVPTALNEQEQTSENLKRICENLLGSDVKKGSPPSLLEQVPLGLSLTVHWACDCFLDSK